MLEFAIGEDDFEGVFMISPQLANEAIIGCQLLKECSININFERGSISYVRDGIFRQQYFEQKEEQKSELPGYSSEDYRCYKASSTLLKQPQVKLNKKLRRNNSVLDRRKLKVLK
jgi:hypothetical protein